MILLVVTDRLIDDFFLPAAPSAVKYEDEVVNADD